MHGPSAPPFSFLCVCQHEPKKVFSGTEESWKWGSKDPTVWSAKPRSYLLFCPRALGNGSRLLAAGQAQSCNSIHAALGAEPVCSCQSSRCSRYLAAKSSFPAGAGAMDISVWPHGHRFSEAHVLPLSGSRFSIYGLVFSDKSQYL